MSRKEFHDPELIDKLAYHYKEIIKLIGEDPEREGLLKTPIRAAKAIVDITAGYRLDPKETIRKAVFENCGNSNMVIVKDIEFYSMCEHHILPFFGTLSIGYIPDGKIVGLSKLARITDIFARRLQVQERLTSEVCDIVADVLPTKGVMVKCEAQHLCMKMRGVEKQNSATVTYDCNGRFAEDASLRNEFLALVNK